MTKNVTKDVTNDIDGNFRLKHITDDIEDDAKASGKSNKQDKNKNEAAYFSALAYVWANFLAREHHLEMRLLMMNYNKKINCVNNGEQLEIDFSNSLNG